MPKSKNRKNHKQKARARGIAKQCARKQFEKKWMEIQRLGEENYRKMMEDKQIQESEQIASEELENLQITDEINVNPEIDITDSKIV